MSRNRDYRKSLDWLGISLNQGPCPPNFTLTPNSCVIQIRRKFERNVDASKNDVPINFFQTTGSGDKHER
jgi:hypothetical protein